MLKNKGKNNITKTIKGKRKVRINSQIVPILIYLLASLVALMCKFLREESSEERSS